jgi:hypothetical protein
MRRSWLNCLVVAALMVAVLPGVAAKDGPTTDHVTGSGLVRAPGPESHIWVSAHSDSDGSDARGKVVFENLVSGAKVTAQVVCLDVYGDWAAVGATVVESDVPPPLFQVGSDIVQFFVDGGTPGPGSDRTFTARMDAETCSVSWVPYLPASWWMTLEQGNHVVRDGE